MFEVTVIKHFSGAHNLRNYKGKCEALHGHNWKIEVTLKGENLNKTGMLADFTKLKKILDKVLSKVDHKYLNKTPPFNKLNPTAENIAEYIYKQVAKYHPEVSKVTVWESDNSYATYIG